MKLKELVANSLPRVRGKKKKSPTLGNCPVPSPGGNVQSSSSPKSPTSHHLPLASPASAVMAASSFNPCTGQDLGASQLSFGGGYEYGSEGSNSFSTFFPARNPPRGMAKDDAHTSALTWRGNALYRGIHSDAGSETATERIFSTELVSAKFSRGRKGVPYRGMTTSHSAEGISAHHLLLMSRTGYDARMAVSEYGGSCSSQMSVISESAVEAYSSALRQRQHQQQQHQLTNLNAHYHQHSHQHIHHYHHHHHLLPARGIPLAQHPPPGQQPATNMAMGGIPSVNGLPTYAVPHATAQPSYKPGVQQQHHKQPKDRGTKKQELGFFRKSFASFKSMRKHHSGYSNNNTLVSPPPAKAGCVAPLTKANLAASEHLRCSVCPYPGRGGVTSAPVMTSASVSAAATAGGGSDKSDTRPAKPKRKGFRGLSKSKSKKNAPGKENKGESADVSSCVSDNDAQSMIVAVGQPISEPALPGLYPTWDRPRRRECSVESFASSRLCGSSREGSCIRDLDASGFDSASLSGYESDFHRGAKAHRSRSRIRTNPWLPSPQPSLGVVGGCRRGEGGGKLKDGEGELRESLEDMAIGEELDNVLLGSSRAIARSASFEHRRPATLKSLTSSYHPGCQNFTSVVSADATHQPDILEDSLRGTGEGKLHIVTHNGSRQTQRPLTPSVDPENLTTMSLDRPHKNTSPALLKKPSWWNFGRRNSKKEASVKFTNVSNSTSVSSSSSSSQQNLVIDNQVSTVCSSNSSTAAAAAMSASVSASRGLNNGPVNKAHNNRQGLNDLNMDTAPPVLRSRPSSIVSPNSEFVLLAGHLEQLAHNISFEYEDLLNSTLENTSASGSLKSARTDGEPLQTLSRTEGASVEPSEVDETSGNFPARSEARKPKSQCCEKGGDLNLQTPESPFSSASGCSLSSPGLSSASGTVNSAHSPDSGVGGLGSTDGDDALSASNADTAASSLHCDDSVESCPRLDYTPDESYLYTLCPNSDHTVPCYSCKKTRTEGASSVLKHTYVNKTNSNVSSGHDDDSSATISESDVDNTHYHDSPVPKADSQKTCPPSLNNVDLSDNTHSPSKNNYRDQKVNFQQGMSQRPGIVMGSRVSKLEHASHSDATASDISQRDKEISKQHSASAQKIACRPSAFSAKLATVDFHRDNRFGPESNKINNSRNECLEPEFHVNISPLGCSNSPVENAPPTISRMVRTCHLDAAMILGANLRLVRAPDMEQHNCPEDLSSEHLHEDQQTTPESKQNCGTALRKHNSAPLPDDDDDKRSQVTIEMASVSGEPSFMDCSLSSRGDEESRSLNASFDMSDACVQTEFDDDFPRWDEIDALETLEEAALDPAESTRRWLLTGNMQGSADTGYASQARESQIYMDDDTFVNSGDITADSIRHWLSYAGDRSSGHSSDEKTPRNSTCFDNDLDFVEGNAPSAIALSASLEEGPVLYRPCPGVTPLDHNNTASKAPVKQSKQIKPAVPPKPQRSSTRSISPSTVDQMFSNIEQQFQEIFQQRHTPTRPALEEPSYKRFSDSSDSTLESECSRDSSYSGGVPVGELYDVAARCREAESDARLREPEVWSEEDNITPDYQSYANVSSSLGSPLDRSPQFLDNPPRKVPSSGETKASTFTHRQNTKHRARDRTSSGVAQAQHDVCSKKSGQPSSSSPEAEKADYLEFLKDAPLDRPNLKRPLFLVPGVGPVDISCSENVNMFSEGPFHPPEKLLWGSSSGRQNTCVSSTSRAPAEKKIKFKGKSSKASNVKKQQPAQEKAEGNKKKIESTMPAQEVVPQHTVAQNSPPAMAPVCSPSVNEHEHASRMKLSFENKSYQCPEGVWAKTKSASAPTKSKTSGAKDFSKENGETPKSSYELSDLDQDTRALAERVMGLKREKDEVYRKLQAAQLDELNRKGNLKELRRHAQTEQKETLLRTLRELRDKLEAQKRLLQQREKAASSKGKTIVP